METVVVTGGNRGIGKEICKQLAAKNWLVVLTGRDIKKVAKEAEELGKNCHPLQLDLTDTTSVNSAAKTVEKEFGGTKVLINNAGIIAAGDFLSASFEEIQTVLDTNYMGVIRSCKAFAPQLIKSAGQIINISSGMGSIDGIKSGGYSGYRLSKANLNSLTEHLASEFSQHQVAVNAVCPGWVRTKMGGAGANRSVEQGADTPVWLACQKNPKSGHFWRDRQIISW